jgi:hypothetical protein
MQAFSIYRRCVVSLLVILLAACGLSSGPPENLVSDESGASDYAETLFDRLPENAQQEVTAAQAAIEASLKATFEQATADGNRSVALARFADQRLSVLDRLYSSLPAMGDAVAKAEVESETQEGKGFSEFNLRSSQAKLVTALREREINKRYYEAALKADPAVAEAHRRWSADTHSPKSSLARIVEGFAYEPCALAAEGKPGTDRFTSEGVTLGMDRASALAALCAAARKDLMLGREVLARSHSGNYLDFGFGTSSNLPELPWTMTVPFQTMDASVTRYDVGKSYPGSAQYCFGCKSKQGGGRPDGYAQMRNNIELRFLVDGKVAGITRTQAFGRMMEKEVGNGIHQLTWEPAPQPLKTLLTPLQQRFGPPSFIWSSGERPVYGWVYPDGKVPLPQEKWFLTHATSFDMLQLNAPGLIFDEQTFSRKKLAAAKPRAGYCLNRHGDPWGNARYFAGRYFTYDVDWARNEAYLAARQSGKLMSPSTPVAYNVRYEAPGFVERCGIIVMATFAKDDNISDNRGSYEDAVKPLDLNVPIYRLTVRMVDTNAVRAQFVSEERAVRAKQPADAVTNLAVAQNPVKSSGNAAAANWGAGKMKANDYGAWKTCLYKRLKNRFEYEDEIRCQALDPQGRVPRR